MRRREVPPNLPYDAAAKENTSLAWCHFLSMGRIIIRYTVFYFVVHRRLGNSWILFIFPNRPPSTSVIAVYFFRYCWLRCINSFIVSHFVSQVHGHSYVQRKAKDVLTQTNWRKWFWQVNFFLLRLVILCLGSYFVRRNPPRPISRGPGWKVVNAKHLVSWGLR